MILVGAFAKSAQLPLHTWLPDAMEGPTPVSALIHAATMVTAGVYLIARCHPLFELAPDRRGRGRDHRHRHAGVRGLGGAGGDRPQTGDRLLDDVADRLHDPRRLGGRVRRRDVPPDDPRLLQGAAVHGRRLGDRGRWAASSRWTGWAASARRCRSRSSRSRSARSALAGFPLLSGFFSKDEILSFTHQPRRRLRGARRGRLLRRAAHRLLRRSGWCSACSSGRRCPRRRELEQGHLAHGDHANPATGEEEDTDVGFPGLRAPHRRARVADEGRDGAAGAARDRRRASWDPGRDRHARALPRAHVRRTPQLAQDHPTDGEEWIGPRRGRHASSIAGHRVRLSLPDARPGAAAAHRASGSPGRDRVPR